MWNPSGTALLVELSSSLMENPIIQNFTKSNVLLLALTKHPNNNKIQMIQPFSYYLRGLLKSIKTVIKLVPKTIK